MRVCKCVDDQLSHHWKHHLHHDYVDAYTIVLAITLDDKRLYACDNLRHKFRGAMHSNRSLLQYTFNLLGGNLHKLGTLKKN